MLFLGHIAVSLLLADATRTDRAAAVAGNLVPDVVDKTGAWVLKAMPDSRWLAHGLPFFGLVNLAVILVLDRRRSRAFALGYAGHLACDLWAGGRVPWFAPFGRPPAQRGLKTPGRKLLYLLPEFIGAPIVWVLLRRSQSKS
jgi:hypothetical protein